MQVLAPVVEVDLLPGGEIIHQGTWTQTTQSNPALTVHEVMYHMVEQQCQKNMKKNDLSPCIHAGRRQHFRPLQQRKATSCMKNEHTVLLTCHEPDSWNMISQKSEQEQNLFPAHEGVKSNTVKRPVKEQELQYCKVTSHSFYLGRWVASGMYWQASCSCRWNTKQTIV